MIKLYLLIFATLIKASRHLHLCWLKICGVSCCCGRPADSSWMYVTKNFLVYLQEWLKNIITASSYFLTTLYIILIYCIHNNGSLTLLKPNICIMSIDNTVYITPNKNAHYYNISPGCTSEVLWTTANGKRARRCQLQYPRAAPAPF